MEESKTSQDNGKILPLSYFKAPGGCLFFRKRYNAADFKVIFNQISEIDGLTTQERNLVLTRFNRITSTISKRYFYVALSYTLTKTLTISCGIVNPALLTLISSDNTSYFDHVFWTVWVLQLLTSLTTALAAFLKLDRRFLIMSAYKTRIEQEMYLYLALVGRYGIINDQNSREVEAQRTFHATKIDVLMFRLEYLFRKLKQSTLDLDASAEGEESGGGKTERAKSSESQRGVGGGNNSGKDGTLLGDLNGTPRTTTGGAGGFMLRAPRLSSAVTPAVTPSAASAATHPPTSRSRTSVGERLTSALENEDE